jgi:hypothetical protein
VGREKSDGKVCGGRKRVDFGGIIAGSGGKRKETGEKRL